VTDRIQIFGTAEVRWLVSMPHGSESPEDGARKILSDEIHRMSSSFGEGEVVVVCVDVDDDSITITKVRP